MAQDERRKRLFGGMQVGPRRSVLSFDFEDIHPVDFVDFELFNRLMRNATEGR
jgi:hypothetical protein